MPVEATPQRIVRALFAVSMGLDRVGSATSNLIGINQSDLIALSVLVESGPLAPSALAARLGLTPAAVSAMATRLERGGFAARSMDPADRRRALITASDDGAARAFALFDDLYTATLGLSAGIEQRALESFAELLEHYASTLDEHAHVLTAALDRPPAE